MNNMWKAAFFLNSFEDQNFEPLKILKYQQGIRLQFFDSLFIA